MDYRSGDNKNDRLCLYGCSPKCVIAGLGCGLDWTPDMSVMHSTCVKPSSFFYMCVSGHAEVVRYVRVEAMTCWSWLQSQVHHRANKRCWNNTRRDWMSSRWRSTYMGGVLVRWICSSFSRISSRSFGYSSKRLLNPVTENSPAHQPKQHFQHTATLPAAASEYGLTPHTT